MAKTAAVKMTKEERREQQLREYRQKQVAQFRERIEREASKRSYTDRAAFETESAGERSVIALYELVNDFRRTRDQLRRDVTRLRERMDEALVRLDANESPSHYTTVTSDLPQDIERSASQLTTLREAIARVSWLTGWFVPDIMTERALQQRQRLLSLRVERDGPEVAVGTDDTEDEIAALERAAEAESVWVVLVGDERQPERFASETDAWIHAARLAGESIG